MLNAPARGESCPVAYVGGEPPHPLSVTLARELHCGARVLVLGAGSGRSLPPLETAGLIVDVATAEDESLERFAGPYDGILSTHALLHGTCDGIARRVAGLRTLLAPGGRLHATFGSTLDPRCGVGAFIEGDGWAPTEGRETGVPHAYFHHAALAAVMQRFRWVAMEERDVSEIVGRWAHPGDDPERPSMHWLVEAVR